MKTEKKWINVSITIMVSDSEQHYFSTHEKGTARQEFNIPFVARNAIDYTTVIKEVVEIAAEDFDNPKEEEIDE